MLQEPFRYTSVDRQCSVTSQARLSLSLIKNICLDDTVLSLTNCGHVICTKNLLKKKKKKICDSPFPIIYQNTRKQWHLSNFACTCVLCAKTDNWILFSNHNQMLKMLFAQTALWCQVCIKVWTWNKKTIITNSRDEQTDTDWKQQLQGSAHIKTFPLYFNLSNVPKKIVWKSND